MVSVDRTGKQTEPDYWLVGGFHAVKTRQRVYQARHSSCYTSDERGLRGALRMCCNAAHAAKTSYRRIGICD